MICVHTQYKYYTIEHIWRAEKVISLFTSRTYNYFLLNKICENEKILVQTSSFLLDIYVWIVLLPNLSLSFKCVCYSDVYVIMHYACGKFVTKVPLRKQLFQKDSLVI